MGSLIRDQPLGQSWAGWQPTCASVARISGESLLLLPRASHRDTRRDWRVLLDLAQESWHSQKSMEPPGIGRSAYSPDVGEGVIPVRWLGCPPKLPQLPLARRVPSPAAPQVRRAPEITGKHEEDWTEGAR